MCYLLTSNITNVLYHVLSSEDSNITNVLCMCYLLKIAILQMFHMYVLSSKDSNITNVLYHVLSSEDSITNVLYHVLSSEDSNNPNVLYHVLSSQDSNITNVLYVCKKYNQCCRCICYLLKIAI